MATVMAEPSLFALLNAVLEREGGTWTRLDDKLLKSYLFRHFRELDSFTKVFQKSDRLRERVLMIYSAALELYMHCLSNQESYISKSDSWAHDPCKRRDEKRDQAALILKSLLQKRQKDLDFSKLSLRSFPPVWSELFDVESINLFGNFLPSQELRRQVLPL